MNWTSSADLQAQLKKRWARGILLQEYIQASDLFPLRLILKVPSSSDLSEQFDAVRDWVRDLQGNAKDESGQGYRLVWRSVRHRVIGTNAVPQEAWVDTLDDALILIGKTREARRFVDMVDQTRARMSAVLPWLAKYPLQALKIADDWPCLISVCAWLTAHPRPNIYIRQIDVPGVHTKFIEHYRPVLNDLFAYALSPEMMDLSAANGLRGFLQRYGFRDKPVRVRFRVLDAAHALLPGNHDQDITVCHETFASLNPRVSRVFITENEINFLAFPALTDSMVIFGSGYGVDMLRQAQWLQDKAVYYWGDLDTHGFAILDQLRSHLPHAVSFLMDRQTLMTHQDQWVIEPQPALHDLPRLTPGERAVYDDLRWKRLQDGDPIRLEQERVSYARLMQALVALPSIVCSTFNSWHPDQKN